MEHFTCRISLKPFWEYSREIVGVIFLFLQIGSGGSEQLRVCLKTALKLRVSDSGPRLSDPLPPALSHSAFLPPIGETEAQKSEVQSQLLLEHSAASALFSACLFLTRILSKEEPLFIEVEYELAFF